jgi:hypothetical protein
MKLSECIKIESFDFDPDATTETEISWTDLRDFNCFLAQFVRTIGAGAVTLKIQGSAASDGSNPVDVVTKTVSAEPDAVGDCIFLEATENDFLAAGEGLRYGSAVVSVATAGDEGVVTYVLGGAQHKYAGLTSDIVA